MLISRSKVYELALSSIKEEHMDDFLKLYIPHVFPILSEYGGRFFMNGPIQHSAAKRFPAKTFALLEWPSIDQFVEINRDKRIIPLLERRNHYLEFIKEGCFYKVLEDVYLEIPKDRTMILLLSNRTLPEDRGVRLQWISDVRNSELSSNLYFSHGVAKRYDGEKDIEEFSLHIA